MIMNCRLCASADKSLLLKDNGCRIVRCDGCGFVSAEHDFSPDELKKTYDGYFPLDKPTAIFDNLAKRNNIYSHAVQALEKSMPGHGKLLDVGAAFGNFLLLSQDKGWLPYGLDLNPRAVAFMNNELHIPAAVRDLLDYDGESGFKAITFIDTLEHVNRPLEYLKKSASLLEDDGIIYIRVPNVVFHLAKTRFMRLFKPAYQGMEAPLHINHFSPETLELALVKSGFADIRITPSPQEDADEPAKKIYGWLVGIIFKITGSCRFANMIEATAKKKI